MLDNIINLIKDKATKTFVEKTDVPNEKAEEVAEAAGTSIFESLKKEVLEGDLNGVKDVLAGSKPLDTIKEQPLVKKMMESLSGKIQEKTGVDKTTADEAAECAVPELVEEVSEKFASDKEEDSAFDLKSLIKDISSGANQENLMNTAKDYLKQADSTLGNALQSVFGGKSEEEETAETACDDTAETKETTNDDASSESTGINQEALINTAKDYLKKADSTLGNALQSVFGGKSETKNKTDNTEEF